MGVIEAACSEAAAPSSGGERVSSKLGTGLAHRDENVRSADAPAKSVTRTVKVNVPAAVGVTP